MQFAASFVEKAGVASALVMNIESGSQQNTQYFMSIDNGQLRHIIPVRLLVG